MAEQSAYIEPAEKQDAGTWEGQMRKASRKLPLRKGSVKAAPRRADAGSWVEVWRQKRRGRRRKVLVANWRRDCNLFEFYFKDADQIAMALGFSVTERRHPRNEIVSVCSIRAFFGRKLSHQAEALCAAGFEVIPDHSWPDVPIQSDAEEVNLADLSSDMRERIVESIRNFEALQTRRSVVAERLSELGAFALVEIFKLKELHDTDLHALQSKVSVLEDLAELLAIGDPDRPIEKNGGASKRFATD